MTVFTYYITAITRKGARKYILFYLDQEAPQVNIETTTTEGAVQTIDLTDDVVAEDFQMIGNDGLLDLVDEDASPIIF